MSRYRVEEASAVSIARNIYGPGGLALGYIYGSWKPEAERFKRFIESHDEIVTVLRGAMHAMGPKDCYTPIIEKLINRIGGEEAQ
jgi:cytochrome b